MLYQHDVSVNITNAGGCRGCAGPQMDALPLIAAGEGSRQRLLLGCIHQFPTHLLQWVQSASFLQSVSNEFSPRE